MLQCLDAYQLLREDMDNLVDLTTWQGRPSPMKNIDAKVGSPAHSLNQFIPRGPETVQVVEYANILPDLIVFGSIHLTFRFFFNGFRMLLQ